MYVGERIGGYLGVRREGSQPRSSIEWDPLTLKKGSVRGEGGQEKKK